MQVLTRAECNNDNNIYRFFDAERNDIWALGVIFANVLSGRLPWGRASEDDDNYLRHLRHPHFLRQILPISLEANYILQRIFHPSVEFTPSLDDVREMLLKVDTFFMGDEEISKSAKLQKVAEQFRLASPMVSVPTGDYQSLESSSEDSDDSLLDDSDDSDEHSVGLHSPSLLALEEGNWSPEQDQMKVLLVQNSPSSALLATPLLGVEAARSALLTPSQPRLTPEAGDQQVSSATLVDSAQSVGAGKGHTLLRLSRSVRQLFNGGIVATTCQ